MTPAEIETILKELEENFLKEKPQGLKGDRLTNFDNFRIRRGKYFSHYCLSYQFQRRIFRIITRMKIFLVRDVFNKTSYFKTDLER